VSFVRLALSIWWLHFALGSARYCPLWVLVVTPALAHLSCAVPGLRRPVVVFWAWWSPDIRRWLSLGAGPARGLGSLPFAVGLIVLAPWFGPIVTHMSPDDVTEDTLQAFVAASDGQKIFHSINLGGYLTWHGWNRKPRLRTFIDDRTNVHGQEHTEEYFAIMSAQPGWHELLTRHGVELAIVPAAAPLAKELSQREDWHEVARDAAAIIFRRVKPKGQASS
jgi:hypothetical protein